MNPKNTSPPLRGRARWLPVIALLVAGLALLLAAGHAPPLP